ncbi:MAG: hypothetical protein WCC60_02230, partial [Ilumatobacteraceae bacterium]
MPPVALVEPAVLQAALAAAGVQRGAMIGLAAGRNVVGVATSHGRFATTGPGAIAAVAEVDATLRPRWVCWSVETAHTLVAGGVRLATAWDVAVAHRLLFGGWRADAGRVWALLHGLDHRHLPVVGQLDLLGGGDGGGNDDEPVRPDGYLRPEWLAGAWADTAERAASWAHTALATAGLQRERMGTLQVTGDIEATTRAESTAELLCAELSA